MKKTFTGVLLIVVYFHCGCTKKTPLHRLIGEADVASVYIYSGDHLAVKYITNDIEKIKEWCHYIADDTASASGCSYDGRLVFKVYEDSTVMKFSLQEGCNIVTYSLKGDPYTKSLTPDGVRYLESLKKIH